MSTGSGDTVRDRLPPFTAIENEVIDHPDTNPFDIAIYAAIRRHCNRDGEAWPGVRRLAALTKCSKNTVMKAVQHLIDLGFITKTRRPNRPTLYSFGVPNQGQAVPDQGQQENPEVHVVDRGSPREGLPEVHVVGQNKNQSKQEPEKKNRKATASQVSHSPLPHLHEKLVKAFVDASPDPEHFNFGREMGHIMKFETRAADEDDPEDWIRRCLNTFQRLRTGRDDFWKKQPFLPSIIMSAGLHPRIVDAMKNGSNGLTAEQKRRISEVSFDSKRVRR